MTPPTSSPLHLPARSASPESAAPDAALQKALAEFQQALSAEQKTKLWSFNNVPDAAAVLAFTTDLDNENGKRGSRCVASRLLHVPESIQQFAGVVDTFVSSNPKVAALVWGSVKLGLLVASNFASYFDKLSFFLMGIGKQCPRYAEYQSIYLDSSGLRKALCDYYAVVVGFCREAILAVQRTGLQHLARSFWKSFGTDFGSFDSQLKLCKGQVDEEIRLALHKAAHEEQQYALVERESATRHRIEAAKFYQQADASLQDAQEWRVQIDHRTLRRRRQQLLDSLSTYEFQKTLRQALRKCFRSRGQWLADRSEWKGWLDYNGSAVFCCSGKIGSGKTVLMANTLRNLYQASLSDTQIAYFFCKFDEADSLRATDALRSLVRQLISINSMSSTVEDRLVKMSQEYLWDDEAELVRLFSEVVEAKPLTILALDGIDECARAEEKRLLKVLGAVIKVSLNPVKLLLTCREATVREIQRYADADITFYVDMKHSEEMDAFVRDAVAEKLAEKSLIVYDPNLQDEICEMLVRRANGMFLWASLQIEEISSRDSDAAIRQALNDLPSSLSETFNRFLTRIRRNQKEEVVEKIFKCVIAARRPLLLPELCEAITMVEPSQPYLDRTLAINDGHKLISHCEHLVTLDEEDESAQFPHHSVHEFLLTPLQDLAKQSGRPILDSEERLLNARFHFSLADAQTLLGRICITYVTFNDFNEGMTPNSWPSKPVTPNVVIDAALPSNLAGSQKNAIRRGDRENEEQVADQPEIIEQTMIRVRQGAPGRREECVVVEQPSYPFRAYASEFWLMHWPGLLPDDQSTPRPMPEFVADMLSGKHPVARTPWKPSQWSKRSTEIAADAEIAAWICDQDHAPLLLTIQASRKPIDPVVVAFLMIRRAVKRPAPKVLRVLLPTVSVDWLNSLLLNVIVDRIYYKTEYIRGDVDFGPVKQAVSGYLQSTAAANDPTLLRRILLAGVDPNAADDVSRGVLDSALNCAISVALRPCLPPEPTPDGCQTRI